MTTDDIIRERLENAAELRTLAAKSVFDGERLIAEAERYERAADELARGQEATP